jgi:hypothetical protein
VIRRGPSPSVSIEEALGSESARRERDRQLAAWCGLSDDEVEPFLRRLRLFDARTPAWEERMALEEALQIAKLRRRLEAVL